MFQALTPNQNENCVGRWYKKYPTLENSALGEFFRFELLPDESREDVHLVDNLKADDERMSVRTSYRHDFNGDQYVAAFGNLYKIERVSRERKFPRGVAVPRITCTLHLIRCASNPLGL
ncbi:MAG: hypothetical protein IJX39_08740 [Clostridia bacterium]|nr:hypothetical protein [Clostridia bacterium]